MSSKIHVVACSFFYANEEDVPLSVNVNTQPLKLGLVFDFKEIIFQSRIKETDYDHFVE